MKKIKKMIIITILFFIALCMLLQNKSYADGYSTWYSKPTTAYDVKDTVSVSSYAASRKLLCTDITQSAKKASSSNKFTARAKIKIVGTLAEGTYLNSKGKVASTSVTSSYNAYLAYYLANGNRTKSGFHGEDAFQSTFWQVIATWDKNVGKTFNLNSIIGKSSRGKAQAKTLKANANSYKDTIYGVTDQSGTISFYQYSNTYDIVGPFKFKFAGKVSALTVAGTAHSKVYNNSNGTGEKSISSIGSGTNFYIKVNKSVGSSFKVKITAKIEDVYGAHLLFLKHKSSYQSIMLYKTFRQDITYSKEKTIKVNSSDLTIKKIDKNSKQPLENVGFIVYCNGVGYLQKTSSGTYNYVTKDKATTFYTKISRAEAEFVLSDIKRAGVYKIYEVENPHYGYEKVSFASPVYKGEINCTLGRDYSITLENEREYIKVSGYAWEDIPWKEGKNYHTNGLYKEADALGEDVDNEIYEDEEIVDDETEKEEIVDDEVFVEEEVFDEDTRKDKNDKLLQNVIVRLRKNGSDSLVKFKNSSGQEVTEIKTDINGQYTMYDVEIDNLDQYYIEFIYNGMSYTNVNKKLEKTNGSKAIEDARRTEFNNNFASIVQNNSLDMLGDNKNPIKYNRSDYKSTLKFGDNLELGYHGQKYPINGVYEGYKISSNTWDALKEEDGKGGLDKLISKNEILEDGIEEIINVNLGLVEREQPDLAVKKELFAAKVYVNGDEHYYRYEDRNKVLNITNEMTPQVKFGLERGQFTYTRALYPSDIYTLNNNSGIDAKNKLSVNVTYKIELINNATNLKAVVNQFQDYYDNKYGNIVAIGTKYVENTKNQSYYIDERFEKGIDYTIESISGYEDYKKITVNPKIEIGKESKFIYVELEVNPSNIVDILDKGEEVKLDNIAEITSYSTKDKDGKRYAGIDKNSQPGNLNINDIKTYEDDTDIAPGLLLVLQDQRETNGIVFEDVDPKDPDPHNPDLEDKVLTNQIREGNGKYDTGEKGIGGVKVELRNKKDGNIAKVYSTSTKTWENAITTTRPNGRYTIEGYLPGDYYIQYEWGDKTYKVQDYKATIVDTNFAEREMYWYREDSETRLNDAIDDWNIRKDIDNQIQTITYGVEQKVNNTYEEGTIDEDKFINKMKSKTAAFTVELEKQEGYTTNIEDEYQLNSDGTIKMRDGYPVRKSNFHGIITNIDFGIIERAKQQLTLDKQVESANILLANGVVLVNAEIDETTGRLKDEVKDTVFIPESEGASAQLKVEIDAEIIHDATLKIKYGLKVINSSEIDYANKEYYMYGRKSRATTNLVKLSPEEIIDYLDGGIATEEGENADWKYLTEAEEREKMNPASGKLEDQLIVNNNEMKTQLANSTTMNTEKLAGALKPQESTGKVYVYGHKLLASNDETVVANNAEIIKVQKNGGATLTATPGNYIASNSETHEADNDQSASLAIIPPSGENRAYIAYTLLAISLLGILVAGILLIKKYVLK